VAETFQQTLMMLPI